MNSGFVLWYQFSRWKLLTTDYADIAEKDSLAARLAVSPSSRVIGEIRGLLQSANELHLYG